MPRMPMLVAVIACGTLSGADINGGIQAGLSVPFGDLTSKSGFGTNSLFGLHVGGHLDFNLTSHHQVRGQITLTEFPGSRWGDGFKNDFQNWSLGAEWVYNFDQPSAGWYVVAGANLNSMRVNYNAPGVDGSSTQSGRLGLRGGGGYTFSKTFSLEGTLNQVNVDRYGNDGFGFDTATWIQVSAVFRFGK